jgi:hypothetical protein
MQIYSQLGTFLDRITNFQNQSTSMHSLVNRDIDRMSDGLMHRIEASVRGELPFLKRKLRHHQKPARLFDVCPSMPFVFFSLVV